MIPAQNIFHGSGHWFRFQPKAIPALVVFATRNEPNRRYFHRQIAVGELITFRSFLNLQKIKHDVKPHLRPIYIVADASAVARLMAKPFLLTPSRTLL